MITRNEQTVGTVTVKFDNINQTLDSDKCFSLYSEIVEEIQGKNEEFEGKNHADFKDECEKLTRYIKEENQKLKECYTKWFLDLNLDVDEQINRFYRICSANTSSNYILPQDKKSNELIDGTKISCETNQDCVKEVKEPKGKAGEGTSQPNEKDPKIITSETKALQSNTHNSQPINGTADVGVNTASSDHTPSVKSNIENASHSELDVTKAANNASSESKGVDSAVSNVEAKQDKDSCSNNHCKRYRVFKILLLVYLLLWNYKGTVHLNVKRALDKKHLI
ncbi:CYIR protein [Plasmodium cynomolgi strain B]|uniref:CYIR protein n=1 Tax=Plasmodium cynomolgi (strain B) TaxID=1120755 RepID=K6VJR3_PLACD|nr:CYIR protein [Plasmodium cynomolgi strain B]GAB69657.1 CYIR protein [Plasmodium cynomolgi strain B]